MNNLEIFNKVASVPKEAQKTITAGRIKGMTDINPMWRIRTLTETFGVCGFGWKYIITDKRIIEGADGVVCAFVDVDLFVRDIESGEWSEAIQGTGGSSFVAVETKGKYTNDECFKMALTDALSVACKALGVGADVYWAAGRTKYDASEDGKNPEQKPPQKPAPDKKPKDEKPPRDRLIEILHDKKMNVGEFAKQYNVTASTTPERFEELIEIVRGM